MACATFRLVSFKFAPIWSTEFVSIGVRFVHVVVSIAVLKTKTRNGTWGQGLKARKNAFLFAILLFTCFFVFFSQPASRAWSTVLDHDLQPAENAPNFEPIPRAFPLPFDTRIQQGKHQPTSFTCMAVNRAQLWKIAKIGNDFDFFWLRQPAELLELFEHFVKIKGKGFWEKHSATRTHCRIYNKEDNFYNQDKEYR